MKLPGFLRSRYSRDADLAREALGFAGVPEAGDLTDGQAMALAHLDWTARSVGVPMNQRQKALLAAAAAIRPADFGPTRD